MTNSIPRKISQLNSLSALADSDIIPIVDSSATTSSASGETKRVFFSVLKSTVLAGLNTSNWNSAYSWGDHSSAGYLTNSFAETDPVFTASAASGVTTSKISNWDSAYGWGDHASAGYTTSSAETSRTEKNATTTTSLAAGASGNLSITAFKAYNLLKIAIDHPAWVRLYVNAASRTSDASRAEGTDPLPGSGVIAEVLTTDTGGGAFLMSPAVFGWNNDGPPATTVYARVTNKDSSSRDITVTLTLIEAEA